MVLIPMNCRNEQLKSGDGILEDYQIKTGFDLDPFDWSWLAATCTVTLREAASMHRTHSTPYLLYGVLVCTSSHLLTRVDLITK
jgi:hypothetical protein